MDIGWYLCTHAHGSRYVSTISQLNIRSKQTQSDSQHGKTRTHTQKGMCTRSVNCLESLVEKVFTQRTGCAVLKRKVENLQVHYDFSAIFILNGFVGTVYIFIDNNSKIDNISKNENLEGDFECRD